jgi:hypothetical protein
MLHKDGNPRATPRGAASGRQRHPLLCWRAKFRQGPRGDAGKPDHGSSVAPARAAILRRVHRSRASPAQPQQRQTRDRCDRCSRGSSTNDWNMQPVRRGARGDQGSVTASGRGDSASERNCDHDALADDQDGQDGLGDVVHPEIPSGHEGTGSADSPRKPPPGVADSRVPPIPPPIFAAQTRGARRAGRLSLRL